MDKTEKFMVNAVKENVMKMFNKKKVTLRESVMSLDLSGMDKLEGHTSEILDMKIKEWILRNIRKNLK